MEPSFDFRTWSHRASDWAANYLESLDSLPVRPKVDPGTIAAQIQDGPPEQGQDMEQIFADFERIVPEKAVLQDGLRQATRLMSKSLEHYIDFRRQLLDDYAGRMRNGLDIQIRERKHQLVLLRRRNL